TVGALVLGHGRCRYADQCAGDEESKPAHVILPLPKVLYRYSRALKLARLAYACPAMGVVRAARGLRQPRVGLLATDRAGRLKSNPTQASAVAGVVVALTYSKGGLYGTDKPIGTDEEDSRR